VLLESRKAEPDANFLHPWFMDVYDATEEVLARASGLKVPGHRANVVTIVRREFAKRGTCSIQLVAPIEETLQICLREWTHAEKQAIWRSTESGIDDDSEWEPGSLDMILEGELMAAIIEELSPPARRRSSWDDDSEKTD